MSRRRRTKDRGPCALISALRGPVNELGEPVAAALRRPRVKRPRFDPAGRRPGADPLDVPAAAGGGAGEGVADGPRSTR